MRCFDYSCPSPHNDIEYTVVAKWRAPADKASGLGRLTIQALCLSGYSHNPPHQPPAQLSLKQGAIL